MEISRRRFLYLNAMLGGGAALAGVGARRLVAATPSASCAPLAQTGTSPYGPLVPSSVPGVEIPAGFSARIVGIAGQVVANTGYMWRPKPDGGACFPTSDGWIYVCNNELGKPGGGVQAMRFRADGTIVGAQRILAKTARNCGGGSHNGRWLSCEENKNGLVWEVDPFGAVPAVARSAMGKFHHEAVASDTERRCLYLTEDQPDGRSYRFTPDAWPDLATGRLDVMIASGGTVSWAPIPNPTPNLAIGETPTRRQVPASTAFRGGEGVVISQGKVYFTTKSDRRVWEYTPATEHLCVRYDRTADIGQTLTGPDNITAAGTGDLFVCEDPGKVPFMEIVIITPEGVVAPFVRVSGQQGSELTGVAFEPGGTRMYFSSQRANKKGITYEVAGPFQPGA
jgi:secreted PhoX family phosphatase